jgi:hypothetical protein
VYHTKIENIQILVKMVFFQISRGMDQQLCYNKFMTEKEYDGPMCCAGCTCTASHSSTPAPESI